MQTCISINSQSTGKSTIPADEEKQIMQHWDMTWWHSSHTINMQPERAEAAKGQRAAEYNIYGQISSLRQHCTCHYHLVDGSRGGAACLEGGVRLTIATALNVGSLLSTSGPLPSGKEAYKQVRVSRYAFNWLLLKLKHNMHTHTTSSIFSLHFSSEMCRLGWW